MSQSSNQIDDPLTTKSSRLFSLFTGGPSEVSFNRGTIHLGSISGKGVTDIVVGLVDDISLRNSWFGSRITFRLGNGNVHSIGGLNRREARRLVDAIHQAAKKLASGLESYLELLEQHKSQVFSGHSYIRYSECQGLRDSVQSILGLCQQLARKHLTQKSSLALEALAPLQTPEGLEKIRAQANKDFVSKYSKAVRAASQSLSANHLTDEQAEAIATDEDATLVLAGAGTGKTEVIVGKIAHLVRNRDVSAERILVLAYNRKAAQEIQKRLSANLTKVHVSTIHAFGRSVIAEVTEAPTISKLAADETALPSTIDNILRVLLSNPHQSKVALDFILNNFAPYRSPFDFSTQPEYQEYVHNVELRSLSGDLVKSFEELLIANFLTEHSIAFEYEGPYELATATHQYRQYQPDFFLPEYDIYIEHFALNIEGKPPPNWRGYSEGVEWKRGIHRRHGTKLVETYSWQHQQGTLLKELEKRLRGNGVRLQRVSRLELIQQISEHKISWLSKLLATFLNHFKMGGPKPEELWARARASKDRQRCERFLDVFDLVLASYEKLLEDEQALDFHDLINRATEFIREARWNSPFYYILVDEFQDISRGRMELIQSLKQKGVAYFVVGDDWQSIYRFAGSDVALVRECGAYLGHVQERTLTTTFRFGFGILAPTSDFIQQNPEQIRRPLRSAKQSQDDGISVVTDQDPAKGLLSALEEISRKARGETHSVLVLGRYNRSRETLRSLSWSKNLNVEFSTVHRAKGREADYVVALDLNSDRMGFPSQFEDDPLLELVMPSIAERPFPFAEERRLFYVAVTRARIGVYLISDSSRPSAFVLELLARFRLPLIGKLARECPRCPSGRLVISKSRKNLRCSLYQICEYQAPLCKNCNLGYVLLINRSSACTNKNCKTPPSACPRCGNGILVEISGRTGRFWGCTAFMSQPPCTYTRNIEYISP